MNNIITDLEVRFEDLKDKFSHERIILIRAQLDAENLLEETELILQLIATMDSDMEIRLSSLYNQIISFKEYVEDLIDMRKAHSL